MFVQGNAQVNLFIGGVPYPLTNTSFENICIVQHYATKLPTCRLILNDCFSFFNAIDLADGCPIQISMGRSNSDEKYELIDFYLTDCNSVDIPNGKRYTIYGNLDLFTWARVKPHKPYLGTTSEVIQLIGRECGFTSFDIDLTNDSQIWNSGNLTYADFAWYLADHAYVDRYSNMNCTVTENKKLIFKNITELPNTFPKPYVYFYQIAQDNSAKANFRVGYTSSNRNISLGNSLYGYDYTLVRPHLSGLTKMSKKLNIRKNYSNKLELSLNNLNAGNVRTEYCPPDCGNNNVYYSQAQYQNKRQRTLFSSDKIIRVEYFCGVSMFDLVRCEDTNVGGTNPSLNTVYIVSGKTRMVTSDLAYIEQYVLTTTGKNTSNSDLA